MLETIFYDFYRTNNENMEIDYQNEHIQLRTNASTSHHFPVKTGVFYTVHRDE